MSAVLDTHAVLWYLENSKELSALARTTIEDAVGDARHVRISAISLVETVYLVERRRLPLNALERLRSALTDPSSGMLIAAGDASVADALQNISRDVVPDMPDRIIAATALHLGLPLVTRDRRLQSAGIQTIW
ncbi:MAG TPA: type II toxin-antitoxin system VapC family toxin [Candidatus Dormibacteraeota bacterium]|jgi:PIN domain nuclease of toxin-antitoxin system|nr:type II toxin-antitoxin system VapC family toxin [Candidatus Dormibacteraeota bacterium]